MKVYDIVGHQKVLGLISGIVERRGVAHAYLFLGPKQVGKETVARWFAQQLISDSRARRYNVSVLKYEEGIKISNIRSLHHELSLTNPYGGPRVVILGDVDDMTIPAQNAFLKLLEEPQTEVVFILLGRRLQSLLPTIVSRTQLIRFAPVATREIADHLQRQGLETKDAAEIARLSRGCPGWACQFVESGSDVSKLTKPASEFLRMFSASIAERWDYAKGLVADEAVRDWLDVSEGVLRDCLLCKQGRSDEVSYLSLLSQIKKTASSYDIRVIKGALQGLSVLRNQLRHNVNTKLALENYLINFLPINTKK